MKITSLQENLKSGLIAVSHIAGKNVNLPILNNILIDASEGNIKLISTDLEIGITAKVRGKVEKEGVFTVDSKVITDFISLLPNQKVEINQKDLELSVVSDNYKTKIKGQNAEEYPLIPNVEKTDSYKVDPEDFRQALQQVVFAVSNSETRIELNGVLFNFTNGNLIMAATDSYRLAEKKIKIKNDNGKESKVIVPAKTLQEVVRLLSNIKAEELGAEHKEIEFYITDNQILFTFGTIELVSRLIEGQYPEYEQIIPLKSQTQVGAQKNDLVRAVKASAIFSKSGINDVNLDFPAGKNKIVISSTSSNVGENVSEVEAKSQGTDNGIVVNYRFLLDGLNNINSDKLRLEIVDGSTPCILRPEKDDSYTYVIMPIKQ